MYIVERVVLERFTHELHYQFHEDVIDYINSKTLEETNVIELTPWIPPYLVSFETEKDALDIILKSIHTLDMANTDHIRDNDLTGFAISVKAMMYHSDVTVQQAAYRTNDVLVHYGNVAKKKYDEETAAITDILREYEKPEHVADINKLKLKEWLDRLRQHNNEFRELKAQRVEEKASMTTARMKTARVETDKHYRNIVMHLEYVTKAGRTSQPLTDFIKGLNSLVDAYKKVLAHSKAKHSKTGGGQTTDENSEQV